MGNEGVSQRHSSLILLAVKSWKEENKSNWISGQKTLNNAFSSSPQVPALTIFLPAFCTESKQATNTRRKTWTNLISRLENSSTWSPMKTRRSRYISCQIKRLKIHIFLTMFVFPKLKTWQLIYSFVFLLLNCRRRVGWWAWRRRLDRKECSRLISPGQSSRRWMTARRSKRWCKYDNKQL